MTSAAPHYPLDEVKKLVAAGDFMLMKGRALNLLVPPLTYAQALGFVAAVIQMLRSTIFIKPYSSPTMWPTSTG